ncbi:MAG: FecR domain-containing protein [Proteobacteria bacterium]|nr:FecR domain-containing protein [Pseudomonadota bacterium]
MTGLIKRAIFVISCIALIWPYHVFAADDAVKVKSKGGNALVTRLEGTAFLLKKNTSELSRILRGESLTDGDQVTTDADSRIEIKLPDNSTIRFDEETTFALTSLAVNEKEKKRDVNVNVVIGKTWANVTSFLGNRGGFAITTKTAVAGVRGTVYRVNVNKDNSAVVKVYWGEVVVSHRPLTSTYDASGKLAQPLKVPAPHPVSGPYPVSMEEWTFIVKTMNQITIKQDGTATEPEQFKPEDDTNDWVVWNQTLDKEIAR